MRREKMKAWLYACAEFVVVINAVLVAKGCTPLPVGEAEVIEWGSYLLGFAGFIHACWKNHNWTPAAVKAQEFLKGFKEDGFGVNEDAE